MTEAKSIRVISRDDQTLMETEYKNFFVRCFLDEYGDLREIEDKRAFERDIRETMVSAIIQGAEDQCNIGAYIGSELVGSISFAERRGVAYIWGLYLLPNWQRKGIGSELLETVCKRVNNKPRLSIQVLQVSIKATDFYKARGFEKVGEVVEEVFPKILLPVALMETSVSGCLKALGNFP